MILYDKSRYDRYFQQNKHKGGESAMNCIKIFHNVQALSVSVGYIYSEYQFMRIFLDNFHQAGKYSAHISSHEAELISEEVITDQKYLSITSLQNDYINLDSSSGSGRNT